MEKQPRAGILFHVSYTQPESWAPLHGACLHPAETLTYSGVAVTYLITVLRDRICRDTDSHSPLKPPPEALARENPVARESSVGKSVGRCVPGSWEVGGKVGGALTVCEVMSRAGGVPTMS